MKKLILLTILLASFLFARSYENRNLLQKQVTAEQLGKLLVKNQKWVKFPAYTDRAGWDKMMGENKFACISEGEKMLKYNWQVIKATDYLEYARSGDRAIMQSVYDQNLKAVSYLLLAELAEGKGRFTDQLINGIFYTCEMTSWAVSAHLSLQKAGGSFPHKGDHVIELVSAETGAILSWAYYFLNKEFDKVNPEISKRIYQEVDERIMAPYLKETRFWWMASNIGPEGGFVNNWNPWCNAGVLQCFLLLENNTERLTEAVYKSIVSVDKFINYNNNDGACEEGPSYWGHAAGKMYDYLQLLYDATGGKVSIFDEPIVKNMGEYISRSYIGNDWVVNFADASPKASFSYHLIYLYGKMINSEEMIQFASYLENRKTEKPYKSRDMYRSLENLTVDAEISRVAPMHRTSDFTWYPQTEFCYITDKDLFFACKGGYNDESHNHNDIGTFSLYVQNTPVFIDAGVGTYTKDTFSGKRYTIWTMQSDYHNLPKINGFSQRYGKQYKATNVKADKKNKTIALDISKAYPKDAGINSWIRTYKIKNGELSINDKFDIDKVQENNQLNFLTWGEVNIQHEKGIITVTKDGKTTSLSYNNKTFKPELETIKLDDPRLSNVWGKEIYRISLNAQKQENKGTYEIKIKPQK